ncbi:MAG: transposase [Acidobacteriota bacterium]
MNPTVCQNSLPFHPDREIRAGSDGGKLTSDGGLLLFYALDKQHQLSEGFSECVADTREQFRIRHHLVEMVRQRLLQIVAGYEDCNDADTLRADPILKTVCDRLPTAIRIWPRNPPCPVWKTVSASRI